MNEIPRDIIRYISEYLDCNDFRSFALSCKYNANTLKRSLKANSLSHFHSCSPRYSFTSKDEFPDDLIKELCFIIAENDQPSYFNLSLVNKKLNKLTKKSISKNSRNLISAIVVYDEKIKAYSYSHSTPLDNLTLGYSDTSLQYYNTIQPYSSSLPTPGIYNYSFALSPSDYQPSGSINFSRIDNTYFTIGTENYSIPANISIYMTLERF
jgi:hypothetical protein